MKCQFFQNQPYQLDFTVVQYSATNSSQYEEDFAQNCVILIFEYQCLSVTSCKYIMHLIINIKTLCMNLHY